MVITFTLLGLVISLIVILSATYYFNQEGFAEMEKKGKEGFEDKKENQKDGFEDKKEKAKEGFEGEEKKDEEEGFEDIAPVGSSGSVASTAAPLSNAAAPATHVSAPAAAAIRPPVSPTQVQVSDQGYASMEKNQRSSLLRDIQKVVRNELIANRSLQHVKKDGSCDGDDCDEEHEHEETDVTAQGRDYKKNSFKKNDACSSDDDSCTPLTDMTKYIRKDQIPCWGCNIDY